MQIKWLRFWKLAGVVILALPAVSHALSVTSSLTSSEVSNLGEVRTPTFTDLLLTGNFGPSDGFPGEFVGDYATVFAFQLPALSSGQKVTSASFSVVSDSVFSAPTTYNGDLYGLGARASGTVNPSDYFAGAFGTDATDATPLEDNFVTSTAGYGTISLSGPGLTNYINAQYAAAGAGSYIFFRVSPDFTTEPTNVSYFRFFSADPTGTSPSVRPTLTLLTPEPAMAGLALMSIFIGRRPRRRATASSATAA